MARATLVVLAAAAAIIAASSAPEPPVSRYPDAYDGAPPKSIGPDDVADAVPRPDPILRAGNISP